MRHEPHQIRTGGNFPCGLVLAFAGVDLRGKVVRLVV